MHASRYSALNEAGDQGCQQEKSFSTHFKIYFRKEKISSILTAPIGILIRTD